MYNIYVKGSEAKKISLIEKNSALEQLKHGRVSTLTRRAADNLGKNMHNAAYRVLIPVMNMQNMEVEYLGIK